MKNWIRRARGAIGMGLTWAAAWVPLGALTGWLTALVFDFPPGVVAGNYATMFGVLGFVGGAIFSGVLGLAERRRTFEELSLPHDAQVGPAGHGLQRDRDLHGAGQARVIEPVGVPDPFDAVDSFLVALVQGDVVVGHAPFRGTITNRCEPHPGSEAAG